MQSGAIITWTPSTQRQSADSALAFQKPAPYRRASTGLGEVIGGRDVAQPGSASHWGCGGRRFESCRPDQFSENNAANCPHPALSDG